MDSYGIEEARNQLGDLVERVRVGGEHIGITRYGKPAVVLTPVEWYEEAKALIGGRGEAVGTRPVTALTESQSRLSR